MRQAYCCFFRYFAHQILFTQSFITMRKLYLTLLIAFASIAVMAQSASENDQQRYFDINKSIDIFNSVIRELDLYYVDSLKVDSLVNETIGRMLNRLDPYTEYYTENETKDLTFMITGEYAGIGAIISFNNNRVVINEPYEGLPAQKAGLKAGDVFLAIDGVDVTKATVKEVSDKLKGTPGTKVDLKMQRPGENKPRSVVVLREKIEVPSITHSAVDDNHIGYIHYAGFTAGSSDDVKQAFLQLKEKGAQSLIMDLRGNGGGSLDEAVNIVNFFLPKDTEIVATRGKVKAWERTYKTTQKPLDEQIPIVVLIDTGSASASEIVAGSLQDLDRAVIVGNRSFGKGLVQTPRQLPFESNMKITTAKYYIPSGRCIQSVDYSHRNPDGSVAKVPDSLTNVFHTKNGRPVRDGGGITPDVTIKQEASGSLVFYLTANNIIFNFVTDWANKHKSIASPETFKLSDADYEAFKAYAKKQDFTYDQISARYLKQLKDVMEFEGYDKTASEELKALEKKLQPNLERDLTLFEKDIRRAVETEIVKRYYHQRGVLINELQTDEAFRQAKEILKDKARYNAILSPKKAEN